MPENFAFNTGNNHLFRRLISTFVSPLAAAYMLVVSLLGSRRSGAWRCRSPRSSSPASSSRSRARRSTGLVAGLVVLAIARRELWPLAAAVVVIGVGIGFDRAYTRRRADDALPPGRAQGAGGERKAAPRREEPARSTSTSHPGGATCRASVTGSARSSTTRRATGSGTRARRRSASASQLKAGESNYTEIGVETGPRRDAPVRRLEPGAARRARATRLGGAARRPPRRRRRRSPPRSPPCSLIAVQTDAYGIPWLGYCLWWLCGSLTAASLRSTSSVRP